MITNKGNNIITKYLLGQAPEYAGYIAVGVGATPLAQTEIDSTLPTKKSMDFEAFRIPILSKGLVSDTISLDLAYWSASAGLITASTSSVHNLKVDDEITLIFSASANLGKQGTYKVTAILPSNTFYYQDVTEPNATWVKAVNDTATVTYARERIIFKGELPTDQKYEMSEIAVYPADKNSLALAFDSKLLAGFVNESWQYRNATGGSNLTIETVTTPICSLSGDIIYTGASSAITFKSTTATTAASALFINSDNQLFQSYTTRRNRLEFPRLYNKCLAVPGNMSNFTSDTMSTTNVNYVFYNTSYNFISNSGDDVIKLAMSIVAKDVGTGGGVATAKARIRIEFVNNSGAIAYANEILTNLSSTNRYYIISEKLKNFVQDPTFNWATVSQVRLYAQTLDGSNIWNNALVVFDGLRIDNENTENPLYGMVAYSRLRNDYQYGYPVSKAENTFGYIEYRLGLGIV